MKNNYLKLLLISLCFLIPAFVDAQTAEEILDKAVKRCSTISEGSYKMNVRFKPMTGPDTLSSVIETKFIKTKDDSLYPAHFMSFKSTSVNPDKRRGTFYNGDQYIKLKDDSIATVREVDKWRDYIASINHNNQFFEPYFEGWDPFYIWTEKTMKPTELNFLGEDTIRGEICYIIEMTKYPTNDTDAWFTSNYWNYIWHIAKEDFTPIGYAETTELLQSGTTDTMIQYYSYEILNRELKTTKSGKKIDLKSIPSHYKIQDYVEDEKESEVELLSIGQKAPDWELKKSNGEKVLLDEIEGKIIFLDFFYKGCMPCMMAIPELQKLHEKYADKGFTMVGIDPYDDPVKLGMDEFLAARGVTYKVLYGTTEISKNYNVRGYPTLYVLDADKKIIHVESGYSEDMGTRLSEIIEEHLDN